MQPVAYPIPIETLSQIWRSFMETGRLDWTGENIVDPAVLQSWRRCISRLDPKAVPRPSRVKGQALESMIRVHDDLLALALPLMEDIYQFIEGSDCAILLANGTTCVLKAIGDQKAIEEITQAGLGLGTYWSEGQLGSNALALALSEAMPVLVVGAEHYYQAYHHLYSVAAPVHDVRGRIIGLIAVVGPVEKGSPHTLGLVMAAARAISNQLQADWYLEQANLHLSEVNSILGAISDGVIAWNETGIIHHVNQRLGEIFRLNPSSILGRPISSILDLPPAISKAVENKVEIRNSEVNFWINGRSINCLASLRMIAEGVSRPVGYIVMLRPIEEVRQLVQQQIGADATLLLDDLVSQSGRMRQVLRQARIAARGMAPVLIRGEQGVGKNHLARAIHNDSQRADKPFIAVDCRAIPHELMAGEFLGQERRTGILGRPSKFELAHGGTLFLDQIESLSLEAQTALLRVLETGHVLRLGASQPVALDVRVMAATTSDLEELVAEGSFIPHLYYRFGVFNIEIPPVRDRAEDVLLLAENFLARISKRDDRPYWIDDEAQKVLLRYPWPGNVRELESVLERAVNQGQDGLIRVIDLPDFVRYGRVITESSPQPAPLLSVADAEREAIIQAGWACQGRVSEMAEQLGISRTTLWRKMKHLSISPDSFK